MEKAILLISGSPSGKSKFIETAKKSSWCWNCNAKDFLGTKTNSFYWNGERDEEYYRFTYEFLELVNRYFRFEEKYLKNKIEDFLKDDSPNKLSKDGTVFDKFLLIAHGVSRELVSTLKDDYGVFQIHISRRDLNSNAESMNDLVLYEDDENFEGEVNRVVNVLTDNKQKEIV